MKMIDRKPTVEGEVPVAASPAEDAAETAEIPVSLIGGQEVAAGDVIRLKVISANLEAGTITVTYDHPREEMAGSDEMAGEFNEPQPQG